MYGYIYETTNLINGKKYIGQKKSEVFLENKYLGSGKYLKRATNKYGSENFSVKLIEKCNSKEELNEREIYWIKYYDAQENSKYYNITKGGLGTGGFKFTEKQRENFSISRTGEGNSFYGKHHSEETKKKLSESHKGNINCIKNLKRAMFGSENPRYGIKRAWVNNGKENFQIKFEELNDYLDNGWNRGMLPRSKPSYRKGFICINKNNKNLYINKTELDDYLLKGWNIGSIKKH